MTAEDEQQIAELRAVLDSLAVLMPSAHNVIWEHIKRIEGYVHKLKSEVNGLKVAAADCKLEGVFTKSAEIIAFADGLDKVRGNQTKQWLRHIRELKHLVGDETVDDNADDDEDSAEL